MRLAGFGGATLASVVRIRLVGSRADELTLPTKSGPSGWIGCVGAISRKAVARALHLERR